MGCFFADVDSLTVKLSKTMTNWNGCRSMRLGNGLCGRPGIADGSLLEVRDVDGLAHRMQDWLAAIGKTLSRWENRQCCCLNRMNNKRKMRNMLACSSGQSCLVDAPPPVVPASMHPEKKTVKCVYHGNENTSTATTTIFPNYQVSLDHRSNHIIIVEIERHFRNDDFCASRRIAGILSRTLNYLKDKIEHSECYTSEPTKISA